MMIEECVIDLPISAVSSIPRRKTPCCKNCSWQRKKFCSLRWESVQYDEVCSCHPKLNPKVQSDLKQMSQKLTTQEVIR